MRTSSLALATMTMWAACTARAGSTAHGDGTPRAAGATDDAGPAERTAAAGRDVDVLPPADRPPADRAYAVQLASGAFHTCVRMSDGTVRCWGMGEDGQLGDGARTNRNAPVAVAGLDRVVQLAAQGSRTCAVRDDGAVWCWGSRPVVDVVAAQLAADASVPPDLSRARPEREVAWAGVRQLAIGSGTDCAVDAAGAVRCRGTNTRGGVGDGTTEHCVDAVVVPNVRAVEVAVQMDSACARTEDGRVLCWGWNDYCGQLGDGSKQDHLVPTEVPGLDGVTGLAFGENHACALRADGTLRCWGCNESGQLGDGTTDARPAPIAVPGLGGVRALAAQGGQTCATLRDGTVRCWGSDTPDHAQLWTACPQPRSYRPEGPIGDGGWAIGPEETYCVAPAPIPGLTGVTQAVPANLHACALLRDGAVRCWGVNFYGAIGDGTGGGLGADRDIPTLVAL